MIPAALFANLSSAGVKWAVVAIAVVGLLLATYSHGRHVAEGEVAEAQRDIAIAYAGEIVRRQETADRLLGENSALRAAQAPKDRIITKEILRYVEVTPPDRRVVLPGSWRLRHDAAATGAVPGMAGAGSLADGTGGTPAGLAETGSPVADHVALETVGENYRACRETVAKLEGWQQRQRTLAGKP